MVMCMSVFTGCSLIQRNDKKYFEAPVAVISYVDGEKETVTKRDVINGYNSYGYNYVDNYGYTKKQAVLETLETIIDQRITINAVKDYYEKNPSAGPLLNGNETTYIWDTTYEAIYNNMKTYLGEVIDNMPSSDEQSEDEANNLVYKKFESEAYLEIVDGKLIIKKSTPSNTIRDEYDGRKNDSGVYVDFEYVDEDGNRPFKEAMYEKLYGIIGTDNSQSSRNWRNAFSNYLSDVKDNYTYIDFKSDKECFMFELERVYTILRDNYLVEKYETIYNTQKHQGADVANVTVNDVLEHYSAKVRADYTKYANNESGFATDIMGDTANVDYIREGNGTTNYFYVGTIKIAMSESDKALYEELKIKRDNGTISKAEFETEEAKLFARINATKRDETTGEKIEGEIITPEALLTKINSDIDNYKYLPTEGLSAEEKAEVDKANKAISYNKADAFRNYMFNYNDEDTVKNAEYNTVFGVDSNNEAVLSETFTSNEEAQEEIVKLYNHGDVKIGDTTDLIKADDGYYIFFYAGKVENLFGGIDENFDASKRDDAIKVLSSTRINIFSEKTYFDKIYSELVKDNFSIFQNMNMNYLRETLTSKIEAIENNLKDLY